MHRIRIAIFSHEVTLGIATYNKTEGKLEHSTSANDELAKKLQSMEPVLTNLELSLDDTKQRLRTESNMRRQADMARLEAESRHQALQARMKSSFEMRQVGRSDSLRIADSGVITEVVSNTEKGFADRKNDKSHVNEILDELDTVTERLDYTEQKLRRSEVELQKSQTLVQDLERTLQKIDSHDTSQNNSSSDDKALLRELEEIRAEIDAAQSGDGPSTAQRDLPTKELLEENSTLREEVACLRDILYDQEVRGDTTDIISERTAISKVLKEANEVHEEEMDDLREQFEEISKENILLRNKGKKLEYEISSPNPSNDEIDKLKEEIDRLNDELQMVEHVHITEGEAFGRNKLQQERSRKDFDDPEDIVEAREMRSEILALTESLYNARQSHSDLINELNNAKCHIIDLQRQIEDRKITIVSQTSVDLEEMKQLEDAFLVSQHLVEAREKEVANLEDNLISTQEEVRLLSEEITHMSSSFERAQEEYNTIVDELDSVHGLLEKSREAAETSDRQSDMTRTLSKKEEEMKIIMIQLKEACFDNTLLHNKLDSMEGILKISNMHYAGKPEDEDAKSQDTRSFISGTDSTQGEHKSTMDALGRINHLLSSVDFIERHHDIQLRTGNSNIISTSQKAEEIRRKVAFLIYALQKSKKEHSDDLLQLKSFGAEEVQRQDIILQQHNVELQRKLEETECALAAARDSKISHEMEMKKLETKTGKTPENNAEISLLQSQFKELNEKNENLARQVIKAENEVLSVRAKQDKLRKDAQARADIAKELQDEVDHVVGEASRRSQEVDELTIMIENRMDLAEESVELIEKEVSIALKTLQTSQLESDEPSELLTTMLEEELASISDQYIGTESKNELRMRTNEKDFTESAELEVTTGNKTTNHWLVDKYQHESDEKVKAAISATMAYLASSTEGDGSGTANEDDSSADTTITGNKDKVTSIDDDECRSPFEDTDINTRKISETSSSFKSYKASTSIVERELDEEGRKSAPNASVSIDDIERYIKDIKSDKKYERIQKVANDHTIILAEQNMELESRFDVGSVERE
jgi:chromosome segregation ATPase